MASNLGDRWRAGVGAALLPVLSACSVFGGQSGDDSGAPCPSELIELESDSTPSSIGLSADDMLDWALGTRTSMATWQASWSGISTNAPDGDTEVSVALSRGDGAAAEGTCESTRVYVPLVVDVSTEDGLLDFSVPAKLDAGRDAFATVFAELDFDDLRGTFSWQSEQRGVELVQPRTSIAMTPLGMSGNFTAIRQVTGSGGIADTPSRGGGLLTWPAGSSCPTDRVGFTVADAEPSWTEGPALANGSAWIERGGDSDGAPVSISLAASDVACESDIDPPRLPARLDLGTEDGVVNHSIDGHLLLTDDGIEFTNEHVRYWWMPNELVERYGDFGHDLSKYDSMSVIVRLSVVGTAGEGQFRIEGAVDDCQSVCTDDGCSGCGPLRDEVLLERRFSAVLEM